jgi:hypothetical protein
MKLLASFVLFALFTTACVATEDGASVEATTDTAQLSPAAAQLAVELASQPSALTRPITVQGVCEALYAECTPDCLLLVGNARGACLRLCKREYNECLAGGGLAAAAEGQPAAAPAVAPKVEESVQESAPDLALAVELASQPSALTPPAVSNEGCAQELQECQQGCLEFVGNAKGACLRLCRFFYNDCIGG